MSMLFEMEDLARAPGPLHLAVGVFDGLHLGHQAVIDLAKKRRGETGGEVVVITFDPHPAAVLAPHRAPRILTSPRHKARLLYEVANIRHLLVIRFDEEFAAMPAEEFIRGLARTAKIASISVGRDFRFGKGRAGDVDLLEKLGDYLEKTEDEVLNSPGEEQLMKIQNSKKDIMVIRKYIYPMRDLMAKLVTSEHFLIDSKTKKYFKDVQDHTIQIMENTETYRDINYSLKDIYLNSMSQEMNRIMKILTIISTFFIPLTFIVGVYGMNFRHMPELEWVHGYYLVWIIMLIIVIGLSIWFKRKHWF